MIETLKAFLHPRVITMLFFGFSAGVPILLIFSSLSLWLREAGVERSVVTFFSWAALGYSFKFVWAPLVDSLPIPLLTARLGRRRSWILLAQLMIITAIVLMAVVDPASGDSPLVLLALSAVLLGFASATQDIVIDAYRIESAELDLQAMMSATYIAGYRIGMLVAGAGALYLASWMGTSAEVYDYGAWRNTYFIMAAVMGVGVVTTLIVPEPAARIAPGQRVTASHGQILLLFISCVSVFVACYVFTADVTAQIKNMLVEISGNRALAGVMIESLRLAIAVGGAWLAARFITRAGLASADVAGQLYISPIKEFFSRYGMRSAVVLLCLVGLYRISDIVLGVISNVFYQDMGYTKNEIATVSKAFGLFMTITGGFLGGFLSVQFGVMRILLLGAVLSAGTNLLFMFLANYGYSMTWLYVVISADNLSAGLASAAFVAFLSALTNIRFTAMQFAIFTSIMTLIPKVLGGYSGSMVDTMGYPSFFMLTAVLGVPVILLVIFIDRSKSFAISEETVKESSG